MAPPHNPPNQVRLSTFPLSVFPNVDVTDHKCLTRHDQMCETENLGFVVDHNVRLRPETEPERLRCRRRCLATACGGAGGETENCDCEKSGKSEKSDRRRSEHVVAVEEERATEESEISHGGDLSSGVEELEGNQKPRDEGYLGLLYEAAELILAGDSEQDTKPKPETELESKLPRCKTVRGSSEFVEALVTATETARGGAKRKLQCWTAEAEWYAEFEDMSPVVRSKRGRSQVLPYKYRDSVVEPLVRWSPAANHRSISNISVALRRRSK